MNGATTVRARMALPLVLTALLAVASAPSAGSRTTAVLWQGRTPENGTALVAGVNRELRIELEASGSIGTTVRIAVSRRPAGATLVQTGDAPAKAVFSWRPRAAQIGDWTFVFTASDDTGASARLKLLVHVGRTASRTFGLSSINGRSQNAVLLHAIAARARPSQGSRVVARLRQMTPESVPHVLYLKSGRIDGSGRYWLRVPLPILPNGSFGWIPRESVGQFKSVDTHLVIERSKFRATLYKRGRPIFRTIVGVGKPHWPTPPGNFYVRERLTGFTDPIYGHLAFGTNGRSAVLTDWPGGGFIGVHGTNQPEILPGRVSHGCVRLPDPQIRRLDRLMRVGTPVTIR